MSGIINIKSNESTWYLDTCILNLPNAENIDIHLTGFEIKQIRYSAALDYRSHPLGVDYLDTSDLAEAVTKAVRCFEYNERIRNEHIRKVLKHD